MANDFLTLLGRTPEQLSNIIDNAIKLKHERKNGIEHKHLAGKSIAMIFEKSSTRTRVSFEVGISELGANPLFLSSSDIQLSRGEPIKDTARVLSGYVHAIMIRTFGHERVEELAKYSSVPIINGLTDEYHPCQIMADIMTMKEVFGDYKGLKVAYVGDGNNMAHSWLNGCAQLGIDLAIASPTDYTVDKNIYENACNIASKNGCKLELTTSPEVAVAGANVVYTDVWTSMGQEAETAKRLKDFQGYLIDSDLMAKADNSAIFMHCLPAHRGEEVTDEVMESKASVVFQEAENRLHVQKSIMIDCILGDC